MCPAMFGDWGLGSKVSGLYPQYTPFIRPFIGIYRDTLGFITHLLTICYLPSRDILIDWFRILTNSCGWLLGMESTSNMTWFLEFFSRDMKFKIELSILLYVGIIFYGSQGKSNIYMVYLQICGLGNAVANDSCESVRLVYGWFCLLTVVAVLILLPLNQLIV